MHIQSNNYLRRLFDRKSSKLLRITQINANKCYFSISIRTNHTNNDQQTQDKSIYLDDFNEKTCLNYLDSSFKQFESSIHRPTIPKTKLLEKWSTYLNKDQITNTRLLLENINKSDFYKQTKAYLFNNAANLDNDQLTNVFKILKHINYDQNEDKSMSIQLFERLDDQIIDRINLFNAQNLYNVSLGTLSSQPKSEKLIKLSFEKVLNSIKSNIVTNDAVKVDLNDTKNIEDQLISIDSNYNIYKHMKMLFFYRPYFLDKIKNYPEFMEIVDRFCKYSANMPKFYMYNCLKFISHYNLVNKSLISVEKCEIIENKLKDLIKENIDSMIEKSNVLVEDFKGIISLLGSYKINDDPSEHNRLFTKLLMITRDKLLNDSNDHINFFNNFYSLYKLIEYKSKYEKPKTIKKWYANSLVTKIKREKQLTKNDLTLSVIYDKLFVKYNMNWVYEYVDNEMVDVIVEKFEKFIVDCDVFSVENAAFSYPLLVDIHPDGQKACKLMYNRLFESCQEPIRHDPLEYLYFITKLSSKDEEIRLCNQLFKYIPEAFIISDHQYGQINHVKRTKFLAFLMRNQETLFKYFDYIHESLKSLIRLPDNQIFLSLLFVSLLNKHMEIIFYKRKNELFELSKLLYERTNEFLLNKDLINFGKSEFMKSIGTINMIQSLLNNLNVYLKDKNMINTASNIFSNGKDISYEHLLSMIENVDSKTFGHYQHCAIIDGLNINLLLYNNYSDVCLSNILKLTLFHLKNAVEKAELNYFEKHGGDTTTSAFHLLNVFYHFDVTKKQYFLDVKPEFQKLMSNYLETIVFKRKYKSEFYKKFVEYVSFMVYLDCCDINAFNYYVKNVSDIYETLKDFKLFDMNEDFVHRMNQTLAIRYPNLKINYTRSNNVPHNYDEHVLEDLVDTFSLFLPNEDIKIDPVYPYGLVPKFELNINPNDFELDIRNSNLSKSIKMPVFLLDESMCYRNSYEPKRGFAIEIENFKILKYPLLTINLKEYENMKEDKVLYTNDRITNVLKEFIGEKQNK